MNKTLLNNEVKLTEGMNNGHIDGIIHPNSIASFYSLMPKNLRLRSLRLRVSLLWHPASKAHLAVFLAKAQDGVKSQIRSASLARTGEERMGTVANPETTARLSLSSRLVMRDKIRTYYS